MMATIDYGQESSKRRSRIPFLVTLLIVFVAFFVFIAVSTPSRRATEKANQVKCAANLRQIGQAVQIYLQENGGVSPPSLHSLLTTQISVAVFACCSSSDEPYDGKYSYIYVRSGVGTPLHPRPDDWGTVVAFDDPGNHACEGANVLYADGHVDWVQMSTVMGQLNDLNRGKNPPGRPSTTSTKAAIADYEKNWKTRMPALKANGWAIATTQPATRREANR